MRLGSERVQLDGTACSKHRGPATCMCCRECHPGVRSTEGNCPPRFLTSTPGKEVCHIVEQIDTIYKMPFVSQCRLSKPSMQMMCMNFLSTEMPDAAFCTLRFALKGCLRISIHDLDFTTHNMRFHVAIVCMHVTQSFAPVQ